MGTTIFRGGREDKKYVGEGTEHYFFLGEGHFFRRFKKNLIVGMKVSIFGKGGGGQENFPKK